MNRTRREDENVLWSVDGRRKAVLQVVYESTLDRDRQRVDIVANVYFWRWLDTAAAAETQMDRHSAFERLLVTGLCLASLHMTLRNQSTREFYLSGLQNTVAADAQVYRLCTRVERTYFCRLAASLLKRTLRRYVGDYSQQRVRLTALGQHAAAATKYNSPRRLNRLERYYETLGFEIDDSTDNASSDEGTPMSAQVSTLLAKKKC